MAGEPVTTIIGNLTADPEIRFTQNGAAVANFTIASTPRAWDRQANEFKEGTTLFMRCSVWRDQAENVTDSLRKGMRVVAHGQLVQRNWEDKDGSKRSVIELLVDEIGPSLRFAKAQVVRNEQGGQQQAPAQSLRPDPFSGGDAWNTNTQAPDQPPF